MPDPYYTADGVTLHLGDCLDILSTLPDASIDAVVCDPPYGLSELAAATVVQAIAAWMAGDRTHVPDGRGFMGKDWDRFVPPPGVWDECLRVLKPGGHLVAFAGARTVDLMTLSIRIAGFDIRDSLHWIYGSGFPKSLDVSKAIDKAAGAQREVIRPRSYELANGGGYSGGLNTNKPRSESAEITAPASPDAVRWSGFGTALKPAHEPIVLARKPLAGTVAATVLAYGTGALNIGASRVGMREARTLNRNGSIGYGGSEAQGAVTDGGVGRWPSNVLLTHPPVVDDHGHPVGDACADGCVPGCPVAEMDAQSGITASRIGKPRSGKPGDGWRTTDTGAEYDDQGGASRFFPVFRYTAKAATSERPRGDDGTAHPTVKPVSLMSWLVRLVTPPGGTVMEPFAGSGTTLEACLLEGFEVIGIERHQPYADLCVARLSKPIEPFLFGTVA
jgi:DNA modification methylase